MKKMLLLMLAIMVSSITFSQNVTVNPGSGSYADLSSAFAAINLGTHTGAVTVSIVGNTTEPVGGAILNASGSGAASYISITISPSGGAARKITGAATAGLPMIDLNGADNVTFDGLNSGGNSLTIENTTSSATAGTCTIRFIGGATGNTITNCIIKGSSSSSVATNGGTILFSTDAVTANGNDNNTISNNNIGPSGSNLPTKAILGSGSTTSTAIGNSGNIITNNNIFDYFGAAVTSAGIATNGGCNAWTITNNRFYQTGTRTWTTGALHNAINLENTTAASGAQGFTITGNIVGYASNTQTGTYTLTGSTGTFRGIVFNGITGGTVSNINNNTVAAVSVTGVTSSGTSSAAPFMGILITNGAAITNSNTIGSQSATGSLVYATTSASAADMIGFFNFSIDNCTANNNLIGGMTASNEGTSAANAYGIRVNTSSTLTTTLNGNTIGGTVANSIQSTSTANGAQVAGIFIQTSIATVSNNTIRNLTNAGGTGTTTSASVVGISFSSATPVNNVAQNTIFNLSNTNATAATVVTGIQFTGGTGNVVERNFIYGLFTSTNSATAEVNGIRVAGGTTIYRNNMIAVGAGIANAIGSAASNSNVSGVNGINEVLGTNSFFHNSVLVRGAPTAGVGASYAFNGVQTVITRSFRDNIFFNARSNSGATGKNYAIKINGTTPNPIGLTINNNVYFANGSGGVFGFFNSLDVVNLAAWKTAVGQDAGSFETNPQYNAPGTATPDLHIHPTNPTVAEANGVDVGVTNDYDGQTRASFTPIDIGADAGNFVGIDVSVPNITNITLVGTICDLTSRTVTATITDVTGVNNVGFQPRIYFRKNGGSYFSAAGSLTSGTVTSGTWTFIIPYATVGGVVSPDVIDYFIVAQDVAPTSNVGGVPSIGLTLTDVNTITTPPTTPLTYTIGATLAGGTYTVGTASTYPTLTAAVAAYNIACPTGPIVFVLKDASYTGPGETFPIVINFNQSASSTNTLTIRPATGVSTSITGSANGPLITLNGANYVTIEGSNSGGSDRSLTIENTSVTTPSVILIGSIGTTAVTNNTLKNCIIRNGINTNSAVVISDATTLGNAGYFTNITIQNNDVQKAFVGIYANGGTFPQNGSNLTYTQNTVNSTGANAVRNIGLYIQGVNGATVSNNTVGNLNNADGENDIGISLANGTINATVSNNTVASLGYTGTGAFAPIGIGVNTTPVTTTNINITGNTVSDLSTNGSTTVRGISVLGTTSDLTIQKNNVQGIVNTSTSTFGAFGINVDAGNNFLVKNNFVSNVSFNMTSGAAFSTTFSVFGIRVGAGTGHKIYNNSVNLFGPLAGTPNTSLLSAAFGLVSTTSTGCDVRNNIFANNITGGTTSVAHVSVYLPSGGTSAMNLTWNNNLYYYGTDAARQGVGQAGTTAGTNFFNTLPTMAAYSGTLSPAATNDNASQAFTTAVPYISGTDLHLTASNNLGTALSAVTDDFDNETRRATTTDIGADERINCSVTLSSLAGTNNQTVCTNTAITAIIYNTTGASGIGVVAGLPGGVSANWATNVLTISGTPTASGTFNYIIPLTGGPCTTETVTGTIRVNAIPTAPTITANGPTTFCNGGSVTLNSNVGNNNALNFIRTSSQYITVSHSASINLGATFTMEAWVRYSGANSTIIDKGNYNFLWSLNANSNGNKMGFYTQNTGAWVYSTGIVPENTWTHVAITLNAGTLTFYINGVASGTASVTFSQDNQPMNIGRQQPTFCACNHFNGTMDELRLWNVVRTPAQMLTNMNNTIPTNSAGLVAYYKFDEGTGSTTADATSNSNNGTLVNSPTWQVPATSPVNAVVWSPGGATTPSLTVTNAGTYTATVTNGYGCTSSASMAVNVNSNAALVTLVSPADDISTGNILKTASSVNGRINATNKVTGTAKVDYKAKSIELNNGFKADSGTVFSAGVGGCN